MSLRNVEIVKEKWTDDGVLKRKVCKISEKLWQKYTSFSFSVLLKLKLQFCIYLYFIHQNNLFYISSRNN